MRAVSDSGPLHYLILIGQIDLLPRLFVSLTIPEAVRDELSRPRAPDVVRAWVADPPSWVSVLPTPDMPSIAGRSLDDGERATIALAAVIGGDTILMDDRAGVMAARDMGFLVTGTLGLLHRAASHRWIDLAAAFDALSATNFHINRPLMDALLRDAKGWR